ncbi:MAG: hypothetical protein ACRDVO_01960 [Jiangellaceae bacterium]
MKPPSEEPHPPGLAPHPGFLTAAIRRDVADVNRQFLDLALEPALADDPRFALRALPPSDIPGLGRVVPYAVSRRRAFSAGSPAARE